MLAFYVLASSQQNAYKHLFDGDYYLRFDDANRALRDFGRDYESVYEILMPMPNILVESKKKQRQKEKQNASK